MLPAPVDCQATLTVDLGAITDNYLYLKTLCPSSEVVAMVKADAYGMGMADVAPALYNAGGCRIFFVANLIEGISLRGHLPGATIYILNGIFDGQADFFQEHKLRPVLNSLDQIIYWQKTGQPCAVHFDTGINRLGLGPAETALLIGDKLHTGLDIQLIMSHLACSDETDHPLNREQLNAFEKIQAEFPGIPASLANSGGILLGPDYHFDLVRPGLILFGGNPAKDALPDGIKPVVSIHANILQIRDIPTGATVGYGTTWVARQASRIALLNVGYADGYPQAFNNVGQAFVREQTVPVIGRVSMDMIALDLSDPAFDDIRDDIRVGERIELLGPNITLEMASEVSNLSQYEILTGVRQRYQRHYIKK